MIKSFDTVERGILDRVLSSLGLPGWFRHACFEYHAHVRLRFKLASGLGEPWTRDVGIPQGCPLSMMFIVALKILLLLGRSSLNCMLTILSVSLVILVCSCEVRQDMQDIGCCPRMGISGLSKLMFGIQVGIWILPFGSSSHFSFGSCLCPSSGFSWSVRVVRSMYLPAALHGIEPSLLASESLRKLRSSIRRVVWSRRQYLAL